MRESIAGIAHWLLGGKLTWIKSCHYAVKEVPAIKSTKAEVGIGGLQYCIVENEISKLRVIACYIPASPSAEQVCDLLYFLAVLQGMMADNIENKFRVLAAINASNSKEAVESSELSCKKLISKTSKDLVPIGIVYCEPKQ